MYDNQSLSHTMWECKYHIVWILKYRKKTIFGDLRKHLEGKELFRVAGKKISGSIHAAEGGDDDQGSGQ